MLKTPYLILVFFLLLLASSIQQAEAKQFTVVIDAGHGGHDAGAIGATSQEKNINLNVALALGRYIEQNCPDVKVIYTRKTDVFVPLKERADIANRNNADLFISVHTNSLPGGKPARGFETYTLGMHRAKDNLDVAMRENSVISMEKDYKQTYQGFDPNSSESYIMFEFMQSANMEKSVELARMIQTSVCNLANRPDKGVHQAGFLVLRETSMPSCLIELGFITSQEEESYLNSEDGISHMAQGIGEAFIKYKNKYGTVSPPAAIKNKPVLITRQVIPNAADEDKVTQKSHANRNTVSKTIVKSSESKTASRFSSITKAEDKTIASKPVKVKSKPIDESKPIFKVQIFCSNKQLPKASSQFKGRTDYSFYEEGNIVKYTIGSSNDYNEINRLRRGLDNEFPQCFVVAFKNGEKMNINTAIKEFLADRHKRKLENK